MHAGLEIAETIRNNLEEIVVRFDGVKSNLKSQLKKARELVEVGTDEASDADRLILREITLSIPDLSKTDIRAEVIFFINLTKF